MPGATLVVVAARNEAQRLGATLVALASAFPHAPVWVADDGSSDETPALAARAGARVVSSDGHAGKGAAMTLTVRQALGAGAVVKKTAAGAAGEGERVVILCDGDLGESAGRLGALADAVRDGRADIAVAAFRTRAGGGFGLALGVARRAIRRRCGLEADAPLSGQRAVRADVLTRLLPFAHGYGMEVGMTIDAVRAGRRVVEIELDLNHRATGRTPAGFAHRARQLLDIARAQAARR
jgi:glucosyl-3-phosphoglycerate synthase